MTTKATYLTNKSKNVKSTVTLQLNDMYLYNDLNFQTKYAIVIPNMKYIYHF